MNEELSVGYHQQDTNQLLRRCLRPSPTTTPIDEVSMS